MFAHHISREQAGLGFARGKRLLGLLLIGGALRATWHLLSLMMSAGSPSSTRESALGVISAYLDAALAHVEFKDIKSAGGITRVYAAVPGLDGAWGRGNSTEEATHDLRLALEAHVLTSVFYHRQLPAIDGRSLQIEVEDLSGSSVAFSAGDTGGNGVEFLDAISQVVTDGSEDEDDTAGGYEH